MILNALHHAPDRGDVIGMLLVVSQPVEPPSLRMPHHVVGGVIRLSWLQVAFHHAVLEGTLQRFQVLPIPLGDVHAAVVFVVDFTAEVDEEVEGLGEGEEIFVGCLLGVVRIGGDDRPGDAEDEVDGVLVRRFPFQDVLVCAGFVGGVFTGEDEAVVAVELFDGWDDGFEHVFERVRELGGFVFDDEGAVLDLFGEGFPEFFVGFQDPFFEAGEASVEGFGGEQIAVEDEAVEDQEFEFGVAVGVGVFDQFAVEDGAGVERCKGFVVLFGEVEIGNVVVVVFAVDEIVDVSVSVSCAVHQVSYAIRLFADVVVLMSEFGEMARRKGDRLRAWKRGLMSSEEACDFMAEVLGQLMISPDAVDPCDEVVGAGHDIVGLDGGAVKVGGGRDARRPRSGEV